MATQVDLGQLYDEHAETLYGFLLNLSRNEDWTRELLQEVFSKIAAAPDRLRSVRNERAFLIQLGRNLFLDSLRRRAARDKYQIQAGAELSIFAPTEDPDVAQFRSSLSSALLNLPQEQRAVVHLKLWAGLTFEQIADALDIPANTAASRFRYALDKLRAELRPLYDEIR
jgi:RNA polymerase sigma-70 factor (ECF subfamily)